MRPDNLLNTHKPSLDSNIINSPIGDSPSETRRQKLSRFRRNHQIDRPARTTPSNMVKCPKLRTTGPNTCQGNTSKTATECRRRIATASANRPGFGARSGELPSGFPINAAKITHVTKAIKGRIPPRRGIVTLQAPSTPSIPDNVLTGTSIASNRQVQEVTSQVMMPNPWPPKNPTMRHKPSMQRTTRRTTNTAPQQRTFLSQTTENANQLRSK